MICQHTTRSKWHETRIMFRQIKKVKVCLYIVQYPVRWTAQSATLFLPWQTCSFRHQLDFSRKHSSHAAIMHEYYSLTFPPPSIDRYSFIQIGASWRELKCPGFEAVAKGIRTRVSSIESPAFYLATALHDWPISWFRKKYHATYTT